MVSPDLKIQLEGRYELIEAEVARWETAAQALAHRYWNTRDEWRMVTDRTAELAPLLRQLSSRVASGSQDDGRLLERLRDAQGLFHELLDLRLRGFGEVVEVETLEHKIRRLNENLPVRYAGRHWRSMVQLRFIVLAFPTAVVSSALQSVWPAVVGATLFALSFKLLNPWLKVVVTRRSVIFDKTQWFLAELQHVTFATAWPRGSSTIGVHTRHGQFREWTLYLSNTEQLEQALRDCGVIVVVR